MSQTHTPAKDAAAKSATAPKAHTAQPPAEKVQAVAPTAPTAPAVATAQAPAKDAAAPAEGADKKDSKKEKGGRQFTYIGAGEDSPRIITFMGKQKFVRGELTTVTDPILLDKLDKGVKTFVEGKADQETLHRIDEEGKAEADRNKAEQMLLNRQFKKKHVGE